MIRQLPKGCSSRGADMGRIAIRGTTDGNYRFYLRCIGPNSDGYDTQGAYWGLGTAVYWATTALDAPNVQTFCRASSRQEAKAKVLERYPNARFYR